MFFKKNIFEKSFMARVTPPPPHVAKPIKKFLIFLKTFSTGLAGIQLQSVNKGPADNVQVDIQVSTLVLINLSTLDFRKNYNHSGKTISLPRQPLRRWAWSRIISSWEDALQCFVLFSDVFNLQESDGNRGAWEDVWRYMRKVNCARL